MNNVEFGEAVITQVIVENALYSCCVLDKFIMFACFGVCGVYGRKGEDAEERRGRRAPRSRQTHRCQVGQGGQDQGGEAQAEGAGPGERGEKILEGGSNRD